MVRDRCNHHLESDTPFSVQQLILLIVEVECHDSESSMLCAQCQSLAATPSIIIDVEDLPFRSSRVQMALGQDNIEFSCPAERSHVYTVHSDDSQTFGQCLRGQLQRLVMATPKCFPDLQRASRYRSTEFKNSATNFSVSIGFLLSSAVFGQFHDVMRFPSTTIPGEYATRFGQSSRCQQLIRVLRSNW